MRIEIDVEPGAPPSGAFSLEGGRARPFAGWLELLRLLGDAIQLESPARVPGGGVGELAPRGDAQLGERV
jgi:hypothetical protein